MTPESHDSLVVSRSSHVTLDSCEFWVLCVFFYDCMLRMNHRYSWFIQWEKLDTLFLTGTCKTLVTLWLTCWSLVERDAGVEHSANRSFWGFVILPIEVMLKRFFSWCLLTRILDVLNLMWNPFHPSTNKYSFFIGWASWLHVLLRVLYLLVLQLFIYPLVNMELSCLVDEESYGSLLF